MCGNYLAQRPHSRLKIGILPFLLLLVHALLGDRFKVESFKPAFWAALVISIVSLLLNSMTGTGNARVSVRRGRPPVKGDDDKGGPVIDV